MFRNRRNLRHERDELLIVGKILWLKTSHTLVAEHREINLEQTRKLLLLTSFPSAGRAAV